MWDGRAAVPPGSFAGLRPLRFCWRVANSGGARGRPTTKKRPLEADGPTKLSNVRPLLANGLHFLLYPGFLASDPDFKNHLYFTGVLKDEGPQIACLLPLDLRLLSCLHITRTLSRAATLRYHKPDESATRCHFVRLATRTGRLCFVFLFLLRYPFAFRYFILRLSILSSRHHERHNRQRLQRGRGTVSQPAISDAPRYGIFEPLCFQMC